MIKFVEVYAQIELGFDYYADISNIAKFITDHIYDFNFTSSEDIYNYLENNIISNNIDILSLIKKS